MEPRQPPSDAPGSGDRTQTLPSREGRSDTPPREATAAPTPGEGAAPGARGTPPPGDPCGLDHALPVDDPDRYELVGEHARGGLGRVVRAIDRRLGRTVAVKELLRKGPAAEAQFVREALITSRLQHPGIVPVLEAGRWPGGEPYYVMKLVEGRTLKEVIASRRTLEERLALLPSVIAVAEAVGYAHSRDMIHRDLKPSNIVIGEFGETVVVDWGLAREVCDPATSTEPRHVIGTPAYMPPEQARGEACDARVDVYALGAVLHEVLAGRAPYDGESASQIVARVLEAPPRPLAEAQPGVPDDLLAIVVKAMARDPAQRYPNAKALAEDLKRFQTGQLVTAHRYGTLALARRWIARHRGAVAVAAIAAVVVVIVAAAMIARIVEERDIAQRERRAADGARAAAEERSDALRALQAESSVRRDPTAAVAWLAQLRIDDASAGAAAALLDEALAAGVARHVLREGDWVYGAAFSPDGRAIATASKDGGVRLYDAGTGAARPLGHHDGGVKTVAFVDAGRTLVTGGLDGRVLAWPVAGGAPRELGRLGGEIARLDVDPSGHLIARADPQALAVWRLPDGDLVWHLSALPALTGTIAGDLVPGDPARWVVGYADGRLAVLDRGEPVAELPRLVLPARRIACSPAGDAAAIYDGERVFVVDLASRALRPLGELAAKVDELAWSPDGATIAAVGEFPEPHLFRVDGGGVRVLRGHTDSIYRARWSRDGTRLLTASDDATARVWDLVTGHVQVLRGHDDDVYAAAFSPDEALVVTTGLDDTARVWHLGAPGVRVLGGDVGALIALRVIDDRTVLTASTPLQVARWDLATGARVDLLPRGDVAFQSPGLITSPRGDVAFRAGFAGELELVRPDGARLALAGHTGNVAGGGFTAAGDALITAAADGTIRRWDLATGAGRVLAESPQLVEWITVAPAGDLVAAARADRLLAYRDDGGLVAELPAARLPSVAPMMIRRAWSPDGRRLAVIARSGGIVWAPETGAVVELEAPGHDAIHAAWSPDGRWLAVSIADRTIALWDGATGRLERRFRGHTDLGLHVAFSPDGRRLATSSHDRTARLWDLATGQARVLRGHVAPIDTVAWLDGGARLVTASRDGTLRVWPAPPADLPTPDELRARIGGATTAVIGPGGVLATP